MTLLRRLVRLLAFPFWFLWDLFLANLVVAWEVATPYHNMRPGVIEIPIESRSALEVTMLANIITLTPGTMTLEVDPSRGVIYVHALHISTPENLRRSIRKMERRLLGFLRAEPRR